MVGDKLVVVDGPYKGQVVREAGRQNGNVVATVTKNGMLFDQQFSPDQIMLLDSRTDSILSAVKGELEARRGELDNGQPLSNISLIVYLSNDGSPYRISFRTESARDLQGKGARKR